MIGHIFEVTELFVLSTFVYLHRLSFVRHIRVLKMGVKTN